MQGKAKAFSQSNQGANMRDVILADNQSTCDVFCNSKLVKNIRKATTKCNVYGNGGALLCENIADFPGYPNPVWFDRRAITNIISYAKLADSFRITYDNRVEDAFILHRKDNTILKFSHSSCGLYYHDIMNIDRCLIQTIKENEIGHTKRELDQAKVAEKTYGMVGHPSIKDYKWMVQEGTLLNCPVVVKDINIYQDVYGKSIAALKGKTTRSKPVVVKTNLVDVPRNLM